MKREALWSNKDGLYVGFGTRDVETTGSAAVVTEGTRSEIVMRIKLSELADTIDVTDVINAPIIPAGSILESAKLHVETAAVGATAVLDIGLCTVAGVDVDDDGVDAAIATATLVDGYYVACDGAKIGTELAQASKLYASYDTAAFTDGVVVVTVTYIQKSF